MNVLLLIFTSILVCINCSKPGKKLWCIVTLILFNNNLKIYVPIQGRMSGNFLNYILEVISNTILLELFTQRLENNCVKGFVLFDIKLRFSTVLYYMFFSCKYFHAMIKIFTCLIHTELIMYVICCSSSVFKYDMLSSPVQNMKQSCR